ncbi:MAG: hypothetical protein LBC77_04950 [Spirochaetaceae bacterium]|jgi:hypothetical protein|nr:hypothetical protein [Spirochaetaceae bacterium]
MIRDTLLVRALAIVTASLYLFVSCSVQGVEPVSKGGPEKVTGKPVFFFLDENYEPSFEDSGKLGFMVQENESAEGFLMVSEELDDYNAVRFFFEDTGVQANMYFEKSKAYPYRLIMDDNGVVSYINFSNLEDSQFYSISIEQGVESTVLEGLFINRDIFSAYQDDCDFNASQNLRARNIIVSLGMFLSVCTYLTDEAETEASQRHARFGFSPVSWLKSAIKATVKKVVAVVTIAAVVISVAVAVVAMVSATPILVGSIVLAAALPSLTYIADYVTEGVLNSELDKLENEKISGTVFIYTSVFLENYYGDIRSLIRDGEGNISDNNQVDNLSKIEFPNMNADLYEDMPVMTIQLHVPGLGTEVFLEPVQLKFNYNPDMTSEFLVTANQREKDLLHFNLTRKFNGTSERGVMPLVSYFGKDVVINDSTEGITYQCPYPLGSKPPDSGPVNHKDIFVLNVINGDS